MSSEASKRSSAETETHVEAKKMKSSSFKDLLVFQTGTTTNAIKYRLSTSSCQEQASSEQMLWLDIRVLKNGDSTPFGLNLTWKEIETVAAYLTKYPEVKESEVVITENTKEPDLPRTSTITKRRSEKGNYFIQIGQKWGPVDEETNKRKSRGMSLFKKDIAAVGRVLLEITKLVKSSDAPQEQIRSYGSIFYACLTDEMPALCSESCDQMVVQMLKAAEFWTKYKFLDAMKVGIMQELRRNNEGQEAHLLEKAVPLGFGFLAKMYLKHEENWVQTI